MSFTPLVWPFVLTCEQEDTDHRLPESIRPTNEVQFKDEQGHRMFWLKGLVGTGKSTTVQTFSEIGFADGKLGARFQG